MEQLLSHLDAARSLARWLTRNSHDAEDIVQEAYLRAFKFFGSFNGVDSRNWILTIVRNTYYTSLKRNRTGKVGVEFDEHIHSSHIERITPESILIRRADGQSVWEALEGLPAAFREIVILREIDGMSYKEIATLANLPIGTVMSRLARARKRLQTSLAKLAGHRIGKRRHGAKGKRCSTVAGG
jgi:RNA polymerase sigma-70 factor (ECF subfamily)